MARINAVYAMLERFLSEIYECAGFGNQARIFSGFANWMALRCQNKSKSRLAKVSKLKVEKLKTPPRKRKGFFNKKLSKMS